MTKRLTAHEKRIVAEMSETRELLSGFGLRLHGYDPGITAYLESDPSTIGGGYFREPISLDYIEWEWLKPLLVELRDCRVSREAKR